MLFSSLGTEPSPIDTVRVREYFIAAVELNWDYYPNTARIDNGSIPTEFKKVIYINN